MDEGLLELRIKAAEGIARVFFFARTGQRIVMLHQFVKKSPKTPPKEIEVARRRMNEYRMLSHRTLRARALARPDVKAEFERLKPEFEIRLVKGRDLTKRSSGRATSARR